MNFGPEHSIERVFEGARDALSQAGIDTPDADAELIFAHVLDVSRGRVQALRVLGQALEPAQLERIQHLVGERAQRVPLQHLTGLAPFRRVELAVGPGVFIPRPETEVAAQLAVDALSAVPSAQPIAVDLCTGSGALALALATEVPTAHIWALEKSGEAHAWATRNVERLGDGRVSLHRGDVADLVPSSPGAPLSGVWNELVGRAHVVVSNPPYVPADMVPRDPEVREHDPALALYGGADGLDVVRQIARVARALLAPGGTLIVEHAETQGEAVRQLFNRAGLRAAATHPDLTTRDRVTTALR